MPELPTIARTFNVAIFFRIKGIPVVHWVKRRPAQLAVPSSIAGGGNFSFVYDFFFANSLSLLPSRYHDMTEILLKRT